MTDIIERKKLRRLAELEGFTTVTEMLESTCFNGAVPSICMEPDCDFTADYEPDQDQGWCEICDKNTVKSCLIIAGWI